MSTPRDDAQRMHEMLHGYFLSQALYVMARLNIADLLTGGERGSADLAAELKVHADALHRMLRALASEGVLVQTGENLFGLTALGRTLVSTTPGSMRPAALLAGQAQYKVWAIFHDVIKQGTPGFERVFRKPLFPFLNDHPEIHELFDQTMTHNMQWAREAVLHHCSFKDGEVVVDVGGGMGSLLVALAEKFPGIRPVLLETAGPAERARAALPKTIEVLVGDFHKAVPCGDTIILSCVVHMLQDAEAVHMLRNCADALSNGGRVLIIEQVLREPNIEDTGKWADLNMLVMTGGRERTFAEYQSLLTSAGLSHSELIETNVPYRLVVARRSN